MNRLFIQLYLDEDVDVFIAHLLRGRGFGATTTFEAGRVGTLDQEQLRYATNEMAILTHNRRDFENLAAHFHETHESHAGISLLRATHLSESSSGY